MPQKMANCCIAWFKDWIEQQMKVNVRNKVNSMCPDTKRGPCLGVLLLFRNSRGPLKFTQDGRQDAAG